MSKRITIKDIAEECGVSIGTVDRVIHQRGRFAPETEKAVRDAIQRMGYVPKHASSTCLSGHSPSFSIGIYCTHDATPGSFWQEAAEGIALAERNIQGMGGKLIRECPDSFHISEQLRAIRRLLDQGVDAILSAAFDSGEAFDAFSIIPENIQFATVINRSWNSRYLFHIGPNDEAMGALMTNLIAKSCPAPARTVIIAPNIEFEGTHKRVQGFIQKASLELDEEVKLLQIISVIADSPEESYRKVAEETRFVLDTYHDLDAIYITNAFVQPACDIVAEHNRKTGRSTQVFCHETFTGYEAYLSDGRLTATICQNPRQLWYNAVMSMADYLVYHKIPEKMIPADCRIYTRDTLPLINPNLPYSSFTHFLPMTH